MADTPTLPTEPNDRIRPRNIEDEMKTSYIDYAMSVIVGRALPDVRDGLKPVHRRILYAMKESGLTYRSAYKKSAKVVGDVLGKYHPHGDSAVYDAMVRLVQDFSLRYPLIDGQGNFGSIDGDSAAAYRYTEVRLKQIADEMLGDIDKETVDFGPNFDGSLTEPLVLPGKLPNLLINGSTGIAVGMATNIPPHNLREVCEALIAYIDQPTMTNADVMKYIKGPDFPTSASILGRQGIKDYFETGRGSVPLRAKTEIEDIRGNRQAIIVTEIPYQVNKTTLIESIADLVRDKRVDDISDIRDESNREGIRIVIELKREANPQIVLNQLFKHTSLETTFGVIMLALVNGKPKVLPIREMLHYYIEHRKEVVIRRTRYELAKAEARAHILEGLKKALDHLDEVIKTIRASKDAEGARNSLIQKFGFSRIQAQAILDMRLQQLTNLERKKIDDEYEELIKLIATLKGILADSRKVLKIIQEELGEIKEKFGDERRTKIAAAAQEMEIEDLVADEEVVVTISHAGYIKRLPVNTYRAQKRGGKGVTGMTTREEDFVEELFVTSTHSHLLLFTDKGRVYSTRVFEIPEASRTAKGKAIANFIQIASSDEQVTAAIPVESFESQKEDYLFMCTKNGTIKKTSLSEFENLRRSGIIAIKLEEGDSLIAVKHTQPKVEIIIGTREGIAIRFNEDDVRPIGRAGMGVRGIRLEKDDFVVGMEAVGPNDILLSATENGFGKRTEVAEYRLQSRGGSGVINIKTTDRNGKVVGLIKANDGDDVMLMTAKGMSIRLPAKDVSIIGRNAQGVRLIRAEQDDLLAAIAPLAKEEEEPGSQEELPLKK